MDKSLLLGLSILFCCCTVLSGSFLDRKPSDPDLHISEDHMPDIVQCRMCHYQFPGEKCFRGRGVCLVTDDEACFTVQVFTSHGILYLTFKGCLKKCANVNGIRWNQFRANFRCCRSGDLCNDDS